MAGPIIVGRNRGVWELPGAEFERQPSKRWTGSRAFACAGNPFLQIPIEGARDRQLPNMRVSVVKVQHNPGRISTFQVQYVDENTYDESKANRYPRGLVAVGTTMQSGSISFRTYSNVGEPQITSIPVVYLSGTKTYVSYFGMRDSVARTRAASPPPFSPPAAQIVWYDFSGVTGFLAKKLEEKIGLQLTTRWINLPQAEEAGGYWKRTDNWSAIQVPEILSTKGTEDVTRGDE